MRPTLVCTALALALGLTGCPSNTDGEPAAPRVRIDAERYRVPLLGEEIARGGDTPLVTVVVYTDYACPPCGRTWSVMDNLLEDYGQDLRVVFRSFTVPGHGRGEEAVEAAFAAGEQGKFWEMHAELFEHLGAFDRPTLRKHAQQIGLDVPKFMDALDTGAHTGTRMRHRREAKRLGIIGLPASFVNGLYMAGYADEATWHAILDEEIARARELLAAGTPRAELYDKLMASASTKPVTAPKGAEKLRADLADKQKLTNPPTNLATPDFNARYAIEPGASGALGPDDAPVQVVELIDFQCPYCAKAHAELLELREKHGDDVQYVVRHVPLEIHTAAKGAAKASVAASKQGKFWPYHDAIFAHEGGLDRDAFLKIAADLGLDLEQFKADLDSTAVSQAVDDDLRFSLKLGVVATPGFFVNGRFVNGFRPGQLGGIVQEELDAAAKLTEEGVAADQLRARLLGEHAIGPEGYPNP
jgi:protein-disulfide isomerase